MDETKQKLITWVIQNFAARAIVKCLSAAAVALVAHGVMKQTDQSAWVNSNTEIVTGGVAWLATWVFTRKQHVAQKAATVTAVETALVTLMPQPQDVAAVAKSIIESPTPNGLGKT